MLASTSEPIDDVLMSIRDWAKFCCEVRRVWVVPRAVEPACRPSIVADTIFM